MGARPATACRYCGVGGELYKGAHQKCKHEAMKAKNGIVRPTACIDCKRERPLNNYNRCKECSVEHHRMYRRRKTQEYRKKKRGEMTSVKLQNLCACGCGKLVRSARSKYASIQCFNRIHNAKKAKAPKEKLPRVQPRSANLEPHSPLIKPKREELVGGEIIRPAHVPTTVIPSLLPPTLRDYFGVHGPVRLATDEREI